MDTAHTWQDSACGPIKGKLQLGHVLGRQATKVSVTWLSTFVLGRVLQRASLPRSACSR
jgi:hypothetical protein